MLPVNCSLTKIIASNIQCGETGGNDIRSDLQDTFATRQRASTAFASALRGCRPQRSVGDKYSCEAGVSSSPGAVALLLGLEAKRKSQGDGESCSLKAKYFPPLSFFFFLPHLAWLRGRGGGGVCHGILRLRNNNFRVEAVGVYGCRLHFRK